MKQKRYPPTPANISAAIGAKNLTEGAQYRIPDEVLKSDHPEDYRSVNLTDSKGNIRVVYCDGNDVWPAGV